MFTRAQRPFAESVAKLISCNPFLPERITVERAALGAEFEESTPEWNLRGDIGTDHPNVRRLLERCEQLAENCRPKLQQGAPTSRDRDFYEDLVLFLLYHRCRNVFDELVESAASGRTGPSLGPSYASFRKAAGYFLPPPCFKMSEAEMSHWFAIFFQIKRAFHFIFRNIIGTSQPAARFRAAAWQSIFTHDLRRYRGVLYNRMGDITTLITGPSGTGKELAARAVAMARYIPFDAAHGKFVEDFQSAFHPVHLSALSPTLIESELFGHVRGAFTGAIKDHVGRLEECSDAGTVFLDEMGDLDPAIQVKLLRVLQARSFRRVGEGRDRHFGGKVIAATNRDLTAEMRAGRFRDDLYYRLCADVIVTPSLKERLENQPGELSNLVPFIAQRVLGSDGAEALADEVMECIVKQIGLDYPWPGNVRELEQCVRNILVRGEYSPAQSMSAATIDPSTGESSLVQGALCGSLTLAELMRRYCTLVYRRSGSYEEAARRLQVDRRTVKSYVDPELLAPREGKNKV